MANLKTNQQQLKIVEGVAVQETYAGAVLSVISDNSVIIATLGAFRPNPEPALHVVERLALSPAAAAQLVNQITALLNAMSGPLPAPPGRAN